MIELGFARESSFNGIKAHSFLVVLFKNFVECGVFILSNAFGIGLLARLHCKSANAEC
jgi:hypothetical protein